MAPNTIGDWDPSTLTRFIRDILQNQPVLQYPYLIVDTILVNKKGLFADQAIFNAQKVVNYIGQVGKPAFQNAWVNNGGSYEGAGYLKTMDGFVRLTGVIKSGTVGLVAFQLPPGFRPTFYKTLVCISNNAIGRVDIDLNGNVIPQSPSTTTNVILDGLMFQCATIDS